MPTPHERSGGSSRQGSVRAPQSLVGGILLIGLAVLALWLTEALSQGTLNAMGPAMMPRWLAVCVGLSGLALVAVAFFGSGETLERWSLRGPLFVAVAIVAFAVTIRPFSFGALTIPGLGLMVAGPLAILIGGYASPEARLKDLIVLALSLTPFCIILFGDILNLPIPVFPQALTEFFPADWSQKAVMRAVAAIMAAGAVIVAVLGPKGPKTQQVDRVVQPDEGIDG